MSIFVTLTILIPLYKRSSTRCSLDNSQIIMDDMIIGFTQTCGVQADWVLSLQQKLEIGLAYFFLFFFYFILTFHLNCPRHFDSWFCKKARWIFSIVTSWGHWRLPLWNQVNDITHFDKYSTISLLCCNEKEDHMKSIQCSYSAGNFVSN